MTLTLTVLSVACLGLAGSLATMVILIKRQLIDPAWRRWQVTLESERCDLASQPVRCSRSIR